MKLKITDEKLDELAIDFCEGWTINPSIGTVYKRGFQAAESHHQATVDKLMEHIELIQYVLKSHVEHKEPVQQTKDGLIFKQISFPKIEMLLDETDKMMKELKEKL